MIFDDAGPAGFQRVCRECGYREITESRACPICGSTLRVASTERAMGGLFGLLGLILAGLLWVSLRAFWTANVGRHIEVPAAVIFLISILCISGVSLLISGGWQMITARRNAVLYYFAIAMMVLSAVAIFFGAFLVRNFLT